MQQRGQVRFDVLDPYVFTLRIAPGTGVLDYVATLVTAARCNVRVVSTYYLHPIAARSSQRVIACTGGKCEDGQGWVLTALRREAGAIGHVKPLRLPALIVRVEH
jgi:hypothetical protein